MTEEQFKDECARILCNNITFSPQGQNYIITGALDAIWKLHTEQKLNKHGVSGKRPTEGEIRAQAYSTMPLPEESCLINTVHENAFVNGARWIISKMSEAACASGAVDKTVSEGKKLCECYDPFPDENNECRNCNGSTIRA